MKLLRYVLFLPALLVLAGCALDTETVAMLQQEVARLAAEGSLSEKAAAQLTALIEGARGFAGFNWSEVGMAALSSVLLALTGVRLTRGAAKPLPKQDAGALAEMVAEWLASKNEEKAGVGRIEPFSKPAEGGDGPAAE